MKYHINVYAYTNHGAVVHIKFEDELWSEAAREASEDYPRSLKLFAWVDSVFSIEGMTPVSVSFGQGVLEVCYDTNEDAYADLRS